MSRAPPPPSLRPERPPDAPPDLATLTTRARALAGTTLGELGQRLGQRIPPNLQKNKGFIGQLVELALGATAGSGPEPDFPHLGVELKTLPVTRAGHPLESTYICQARLDGSEHADFHASHVGQKLAHVLFVPIAAAVDNAPLSDRVVGRPFFWRATPEEEALLRADFEHLQGLIELGRVDDIRGGDGQALHLRPKAMHRDDRTLGRSAEGWLVPVRPRGWYLRTSFTAQLIARAFG